MVQMQQSAWGMPQKHTDWKLPQQPTESKKPQQQTAWKKTQESAPSAPSATGVVAGKGKWANGTIGAQQKGTAVQKPTWPQNNTQAGLRPSGKGADDRSRTPAPRGSAAQKPAPSKLPRPWEEHWSDEHKIPFF